MTTDKPTKIEPASICEKSPHRGHYYLEEFGNSRFSLYVCKYCGETSLRDFRKAPPDSAQRPCGGSGGQSPPAPANGALPAEPDTEWKKHLVRSVIEIVDSPVKAAMVSHVLLDTVAQMREASPKTFKLLAQVMLNIMPNRAKLFGELIHELADEPWPRVEEGASS